MKNTRVVSAIVMSVLLIVGTFVVSGQAKKPAPEPEPQPVLVSVTGGALVGEGDPHTITVTLKDPSFGDARGAFVANPDGEIRFGKGALFVTGVGKFRELRYYYCDGDHGDETNILCDIEEHDPINYKCVQIYNGIYNRKTGQVYFPAGSGWRLSQKPEPYEIAVGTLIEDVTYTVVEWSQ